MQIVKYDPFKELQKMEHDINTFWGNGWNLPPLLVENSAVDMYEEDGKLVTELHLPKFKKSEITINSDDGVIEVSAKHEDKEEKDSKRRYLMQESKSSYYRRIVLPEGAEGEKASAEYKDGTLKLTMPMVAPKPPKAIDIK